MNHPSTLAEVLRKGVSWEINYSYDKFSLSYFDDDMLVVAEYSLDQLNNIDVRLHKVLTLASGYASGNELQKILCASHERWNTKQHILARGKKVQYVKRLVSIKYVDEVSVEIAFHSHALYGVVENIPVFKGHDIATFPTKIPLTSVEEAFPGFNAALTIAKSLELSPIATAEFCREYLQLNKDTLPNSIYDLPTDLTL